MNAPGTFALRGRGFTAFFTTGAVSGFRVYARQHGLSIRVDGGIPNQIHVTLATAPDA